MRISKLLIRSLRHYRRTHAAAAMTAMVCTAILTGALLVGDSVRAGLRHLAELRLGRVEYSLLAGQSPFAADLAERIAYRTRFDTAAALMTDGVLEAPDGSVRVSRVRVLGVDAAFFAMGLTPPETAVSLPAVNDALAQRLGAFTGELVLRLDDPSALSRDLIFTSDEQTRMTFRIRVEGVVPDAAMGRFGLQADQQSPLNLFVSRQWLAEQLDLEGRANLLLVAVPPTCVSSVEQMNVALAGVAVPDDFGLQWVQLPDAGMIELQSRQLFIPDAMADAAMACGQNPLGVFTYFVNTLSRGDRSTPYSMVAGIGAGDNGGLFDVLADEEIILGEWLADDLGAEPGDVLTVEYFAVSPTNTLIEKHHAFTVRQVVPMLGFAADATLMPAFPGLADADNCLQWDPAIPVDLSRIRAEDEDYWDRYRGAPKAFVSLAAAQSLWQNRFGNLTAVRWPATNHSTATLTEELGKRLDPMALGLSFEDVAEQSRLAGGGSTDFGGLFAGLSLFLMLACVAILAMIFVFTLQQRSGQAGLLLATGWPKGKVYRVLLAEGALLALMGAAVGVGVGMLYTMGMMVALRTVWQDAVAGAMLRFYANPATLAIGFAAGFLIAVGAMAVGLRGHLKKTPIALLSDAPSISAGTFTRSGRSIRWSLLAVCALLFVASFYLLDTLLTRATFFFLIGSLLLAIFLLGAVEVMRAMARLQKAPSSLSRVVVKNITRRPGRSLAVMLTVACGVFMVLGVGLNRKSPARYTERDSGTGGFMLWMETALPLSASPERFMIPLRMRQGDDASCLNLHRAQTPTLMGIDPAALIQREAFSFRSPIDGTWDLLDDHVENNRVPAIGDYATVYWGLGLDIGDTLAMQDEQGRSFDLEIVGILKESIFQGRLLINEKNFIERFSSHDGYRAFLVDYTSMGAEQAAATLSRRWADYGAEVRPTEDVLKDFLRVENTYLTIFLALGGLGLVLGSAGAGLVLLFNVMDRRGELAMMQAMGFSKAALGRLLLAEHLGLFAAGVLAGGIAAMVAVLPGVMSVGVGAAATGLLLTAVILLSGFVWVTLGGRAAMKRNLLDNLRNE